ncbi:MAG: hypothetical protein ACE5LC_01780 [Candidatus Aminicenantales bacterium]
MNKAQSLLWITGIIIASLAGTAAFIFVILSNFNVYMYILAPVMFPFYQLPAVILAWLWKKKRKAEKN